MSKKPPSPDSVADQPEKTKSPVSTGSHLIRVVLVCAVLAPGAIGYFVLSKKQETQPPSSPQPKATEARVHALHREDYQIVIRSQGLVRAHSQVSLTAQVSGRITRLHQQFEEGSFFDEGQILLELDPVDFELAVTAAEAQLAQAQLSYAEETARVKQARLNWEDLGYDEEASDLVLRKPQLKQAEAQLTLAKSQLQSARRDLERSKVRAPFTGRVLSREAGVGQTIGGSTPLGVIFATDYSEVRLPVATRSLTSISLPEDFSDPMLDVILADGLNEQSDTKWDAKIIRTEGALDANTLELFAIARIYDPFGLESGTVPLRVGQPVIASIPGMILENVFVIPREAVTGLNRIRLVDPETLTLKSALLTPIWTDEEHLVVKDPTIPDGTLLVMTPMMHAPDGGKIEILDDAVPLQDEAALENSKSPKTAQSVPGK